MPSRILLQREELWELRVGLVANRVCRKQRFRHRQVHWCVERHAKTPNYAGFDMGVGVGMWVRRAVSHTDQDRPI